MHPNERIAEEIAEIAKQPLSRTIAEESVQELDASWTGRSSVVREEIGSLAGNESASASSRSCSRCRR
jgi:hypothetical protein